MQQKCLSLVLSCFVALLTPPMSGVAFSQTTVKSRAPATQVAPTVTPQTAPQRTITRKSVPLKPGMRGVRLGTVGPVLRTHCNGTCACTGDDCTKKWMDDTCSGPATCSGTGTGEQVVCSCTKKVKDSAK